MLHGSKTAYYFTRGSSRGKRGLVMDGRQEGGDRGQQVRLSKAAVLWCSCVPNTSGWKTRWETHQKTQDKGDVSLPKSGISRLPMSSFTMPRGNPLIWRALIVALAPALSPVLCHHFAVYQTSAESRRLPA